MNGICVQNLGEFLQDTRDTLTSLAIEQGRFTPGLAEAFIQAGELNLHELRLPDCGKPEDDYCNMVLGDEEISAICDSCVQLKD
eukprot:TRINITY_DN805_c0_g1_i2.p3 TRINITY_DN805_c0_g1~~TRINITY_DN805_c0_g1_i2.p3  ORF type:complete len:84 (+),score=19.19 TRINITY_DN805_c0_g1_i2:269-520(+)